MSAHIKSSNSNLSATPRKVPIPPRISSSKTSPSLGMGLSLSKQARTPRQKAPKRALSIEAGSLNLIQSQPPKKVDPILHSSQAHRTQSHSLLAPSHSSMSIISEAPQISPASSRFQNISKFQIPNAPIDPQTALSNYSSLLTAYEQKEILGFQNIYFLGDPKKKIQTTSSTSNNYGFDLSSHQYKCNIGDHIGYRYEILSLLGTGSFGQVFLCYDYMMKKQVALKVLVNTQIMRTEGPVEMKILQSLKSRNDIIVTLYNGFTFREHLCLSFELLGPNLYNIMHSLMFQPFPFDVVVSISRQLLCALNVVHSQEFIHCDIKPENILFTSNYNPKCPAIKLVDFGSACTKTSYHFEYVQSRHYRAPEVMLGLNYTNKIDIWSFACVVIELLTGRPLFISSHSSAEQIELAISLFGPIPQSVLAKAKVKGPVLEAAKKKSIRRIHLSQFTKINDPTFLDLVQKCFKWDPSERPSARELLKHNWFKFQRRTINMP